MGKAPKLSEFKGFKIGDRVKLKIAASPEESGKISSLNSRGEFSVVINGQTWKPIWADEMEAVK